MMDRVDKREMEQISLGDRGERLGTGVSGTISSSHGITSYNVVVRSPVCVRALPGFVVFARQLNYICLTSINIE